MYFTDRGIEELEARRGDEEIAVAWLAERLRDFVNLNPSFEVAVDRLATWLPRFDDEEDLLFRTYCGSSRPPHASHPGPTPRRARPRPPTAPARARPPRPPAP